METYTVRSKDGTLLMRLVGAPAENIFKQDCGEWRTYQPKDGKRTVCYAITRDTVWSNERRDGASEIYLWEGMKVIKD